MARRVRKPDLHNNIIDSEKVINGTLEKEDLKTLDTGDGSGINAETLPYEHTSATPTIWDKINSLIAGTGFTFDTFSSSSAQTDYVLSLSRQIDTTKLLLVFYNGMLLREGASNDYEVTTTTLTNDTIQFKWTPEDGFGIYVVFEKI